MQNNPSEKREKVLEKNTQQPDKNQLKDDFEDKDLNFKILKRKHLDQLNTYEKRQYFNLAAKIQPQSVIHCMSFNNSYLVYVQNKILTIYSVKQNKSFTFNIRKWTKTKIKLLKITSDSKIILISTEHHLNMYRFAKNSIKFYKRIQIRDIIQFTLISPQLIVTDNIKSKNQWHITANLKVISLKRMKIIYKFNHRLSLKHHVLDYHQQSNCIVYEENRQMIIKFTNIFNRDLIFQVSLIYESNIYLSNLFLLNNSQDVIQIYQNFMTVNKLNLKDRKIDFVKKLQKDFVQIHYKNNQLALLSETNYLIFDENFNVKKRFLVNFQDLYPFNNDSVLEFDYSQPTFLLLGNLTCLYIMKEQLQKNIKAEYYLQEIDYYQIQNVCYRESQTQYAISPNEFYLAISNLNKFFIYYIKQQLEVFNNLKDYVQQIAFSTDSKQLYLNFSEKIICLDLKKNLKSKRIQIKNVDQFVSQQNFNIVKRKNGQYDLLMKNSKKLIIKVIPITQEYQQIDYFPFNQDIILSNKKYLLLFSVQDRKQISIQQIENYQYKIIPNKQMILILTKQYQLQLWRIDSQQKQFIYIKNLLQNTKQIIQDQNQIIAQLFGQIVVMNYVVNDQYTKEHLVISQNYVIVEENVRSVHKYFLIKLSLRNLNEIIE